MTWVRLDEEFARHPKVLAAGPLGMAMHVAALCYCNQYLTDGFVPRSAPMGFLDLAGIDLTESGERRDGDWLEAHWEFIVGRLVEAGLWEPVKGGWAIHDFHDFQPSKAEVLELREKRAEAGRAGGIRSGQARRKASASANTEANASANGQANLKPVPVPGTEPESKPEKQILRPFLAMRRTAGGNSQ